MKVFLMISGAVVAIVLVFVLVAGYLFVSWANQPENVAALQKQRGDRTVPPEQAIYEAAMIRFRPIMMTTMSAMMGTLPI